MYSEKNKNYSSFSTVSITSGTINALKILSELWDVINNGHVYLHNQIIISVIFIIFIRIKFPESFQVAEKFENLQRKYYQCYVHVLEHSRCTYKIHFLQINVQFPSLWTIWSCDSMMLEIEICV